MITIDNDTKRKLSHFLDTDGKIMISDDMPEDLKAAIQYLNANNVNILSNIIDVEEEPENSDFNSDDFDDFSSLNDNIDDVKPIEKIDYLSEDDANVEISDLENLF